MPLLSNAISYADRPLEEIRLPSSAHNSAEKELLLCINLLINNDILLPLNKSQVLGKAIGKRVSARLHRYERVTNMQADAFRRALASQQHAYQQRTLAQWHAHHITKKIGIGTA